MLIRFFKTVNRFPKTILLIILALSTFFFYQAKEGLFDPQTGKIRINSTVEPFIERDSGAYQQILEAREAFGSEEVVVVALHNIFLSFFLSFFLFKFLRIWELKAFRRHR